MLDHTMWACALMQPNAGQNVWQLQRTVNVLACSNNILCCC